MGQRAFTDFEGKGLWHHLLQQNKWCSEYCPLGKNHKHWLLRRKECNHNCISKVAGTSILSLLKYITFIFAVVPIPKKIWTEERVELVRSHIPHA